MISTPQEIEQEAIAISNWIAYNGRPFFVPTSDGKSVCLCLLTTEQYAKAVESKEIPAPVPAPDSDDA